MYDEQLISLEKEMVQSVIDAIKAEEGRLNEDFPTGVAPTSEVIRERLRKAAKDAIDEVVLKYSGKGERIVSMETRMVGGEKFFIPFEKEMPPGMALAAPFLPTPGYLTELAAGIVDTAVSEGMVASGEVVSTVCEEVIGGLIHGFLG